METIYILVRLGFCLQVHAGGGIDVDDTGDDQDGVQL
jgi:hypothetical protein